MLLELKVKNFAIIENVSLSFKKGLNVLSGETGAGKSILLKSLQLIMGGKASTESIRSGSESASIEGLFDISSRPDIEQKLNDLGISTEEHLLSVRRQIHGEKSRVYLNESLSTLQTLRDVISPLVEVTGHSAPLIELTGQHENRNLLSRSYHLELLDYFGGLSEKRKSLDQCFQKKQSLLTEIETLEKEFHDKESKIDFLKFQIQEIEKAQLQPDTDENLESEIRRAKAAARLTEFYQFAEELLSGEDSVLTRLKSLQSRCVEFSSLDDKIKSQLPSLYQAASLVEDVAFELGKASQIQSFEESELESKEQRLSQIRKLQKKYGSSLQEILNHLESLKEQAHRFENYEDHLKDLKESLLKVQDQGFKLAQELHKKRVEIAPRLEKLVNQELAELNMKGVLFRTQIESSPDWGPTGCSQLEFCIQSSAKDTPKSLTRAASGGELSRILLSLKRVIGSKEFPRTYLFDEVDAGVSGLTAEKVGRKLKEIAQGQQVICVTHLPQVAACGDAHFFISKNLQKNQMSMSVADLESKDRIQEIARLISGEKITKTSLAHASELLRQGLH